MDKLRRASDLMQKGFSLLDEHRYGDALKVGRALKKLRHSSAFEILALAYLGSNKLSRAIAVLEEGVTKVGRVWILWELLGNCYSDAGRFGKAEQAYAEALTREGCDTDVVHLNRAIAFNRRGKFAEAKLALRHVKSPRLVRRADACRLRNALHLGEFLSARRLALRLCRGHPIPAENYDSESESELFVACALALKDHPITRRKALRLAFKAVEVQPNNGEALAIIREIQRRGTSGLHLFRLVIHGVWDSPIGKSSRPPGLFRTLEIAAPDAQAAFRRARPFFPKAIRETLSIEECRTLRNSKPAMEGVYFLSANMFYPRRRRG
jgi:tetratricopeptide (TPR) repeat protein